MIDATQIAAAMQVPCLLSGDMIQQMQLWEELYLNRAGWIGNDTSGSAKTPHEQKMAGVLGAWRNGFAYVFFS